MSAEGAILDQVGNKDQAQQVYRKALDLKPNEPSVLSNLGMSYVLEGDLKMAETYLRTASEQPGADSRVRQNLALVVASRPLRRSGEDRNARTVARSGAGQHDLSAQHDAPAEHLNQIKAEDKEKPPTN